MENPNLKSLIAIEIKKLNWLLQKPGISKEQLQAVLQHLQDLNQIVGKD